MEQIEHRMFCHITQNWRGRPLVSHEVIIELIGATTTEGGLKIQAALDQRPYAKGIKVSNAELARQAHARRIPRRMELQYSSHTSR